MLEKPAIFIGFSPTIPKLCNYITSLRCVGTLQLEVSTERPTGRPLKLKYKGHQTVPNTLARREARGLGHAVIPVFTEPQHTAAAAEIAALMTTRIETFKDVLGLVCTYEARDWRHLTESGEVEWGTRHFPRRFGVQLGRMV